MKNFESILLVLLGVLWVRIHSNSHAITHGHTQTKEEHDKQNW